VPNVEELLTLVNPSQAFFKEELDEPHPELGDSTLSILNYSFTNTQHLFSYIEVVKSSGWLVLLCCSRLTVTSHLRRISYCIIIIPLWFLAFCGRTFCPLRFSSFLFYFYFVDPLSRIVVPRHNHQHH